MLYRINTLTTEKVREVHSRIPEKHFPVRSANGTDEPGEAIITLR